MIVKKSYQRMLILHKLYSFCVPDEELVKIYILYLRSVLEQSCQVWNYSITEEEKTDLERVQKVACKVILKERYTDYDSALYALKLQTLSQRRKMLCLRFSKKCLKFDQTKDLFPLNHPDKFNLRTSEKYQVQFANTGRLLHSSIPLMQRELNRYASPRAFDGIFAWPGYHVVRTVHTKTATMYT